MPIIGFHSPQLGSPGPDQKGRLLVPESLMGASSHLFAAVPFRAGSDYGRLVQKLLKGRLATQGLNLSLSVGRRNRVER